MRVCVAFKQTQRVLRPSCTLSPSLNRSPIQPGFPHDELEILSVQLIRLEVRGDLLRSACEHFPWRALAHQ